MTRLIAKSPHPPTVPESDDLCRQGVVTYHDLEKGYGKIHSQGVEYFFHTTACAGRFRVLGTGTPVTFTGGTTPKGPRAYEVCQDAHPRPEELDAVEARGNR